MKTRTSGAKRGRTDGPNKAQLIRDAFKKHGLNAKAKDVQAYTEANGATVAPAQISNIRTKLKGGGCPKKPGKSACGAVMADDLIQARAMAEKIGGVERAKELLDILAKLT